MSAIVNQPPVLHRFTREEYARMIAAGVFAPGTRLELLDGEIINMAPQKSAHATAVTLAAEALRMACGTSRHVRVQLPLALDDNSEPEPDVAIVAGSPRDYREAHPAAALLVVEVVDATLSYDRDRKLPAYARAGIPDAWLIDLTQNAVVVCSAPTPQGYARQITLRTGDRITVSWGEGAGIAVSELLP